MVSRPDRHIAARKMRRTFAVLSFVAVALVAGNPVDAQTPPAQQPTTPQPPPPAPEQPRARDVRGEDVLQRFERDMPSPGINLGAYRFQPRLQAGVGFDDNVFATRSNKKSDVIGNVGAGGKLESNYVRHYLGVEGNLDVNKFADNGNEDYWHGELEGHGRLDATRETQFGADVAARRLTEPRGSPDDVNGTEPTVFRAYHAGTSAQYTGIMLGRLEVGVDRLSYDDVSTTTSTIRTDDRDRDEVYADGRVGYRYLDTQQVYLQTRVNSRSYDQTIDNSGFRRGSDGYRAEVGATFDLGGLITGDISAGYQEQKYDDGRFGSEGRPVGAANILWNPTRRTSVRAEARYEFAESFNTASPGYWRSLYLLTLAQEITYDVVGFVRLSYQEREFSNLTREDNVYGGDVGLRYRVDRGLFIDGEYRYRDQESTVQTSEFTRNLALLRLRRIF